MKAAQPSAFSNKQKPSGNPQPVHPSSIKYSSITEYFISSVAINKPGSDSFARLP
jgi:hypothetical protein